MNVDINSNGEGFKDYYIAKIQEIEIKIREKKINFLRLKAQRNDINESVINLKNEFKALVKPSNTIADVIKVLGKDSVLVKTSADSKLIVKIDKDVNKDELKSGARVTLKSEERYKINRIIPSKVDPLVSLMKVEKVPDSTYDMVGGVRRTN